MALRSHERVFVDTLYWVALVRQGDPWRERARSARAQVGASDLVTTDEVLSEFLAALSRGGPLLRRKAVAPVRSVLANPNVTVVPQSHDEFLRALVRFAAREDKSYSLTDCGSMNVMDELAIREVLTNDHHFEQEGYVVLVQ